MSKKVFQIGFVGAGGKLEIEDNFLKFTHPYGKTFRVFINDIETVTVDVAGWGSGILKIIGHGTELASAQMPISLANKCQEWIIKNK